VIEKEMEGFQKTEVFKVLKVERSKN